MAIIKIRGKKDIIEVDYEIAKRVKQRKFGDENAIPPISKANPTDLCDLGEKWSGEYGRIVEIELGVRPRIDVRDLPEPELTPEQKRMVTTELEDIGKWVAKQGWAKKIKN